MNKPRNRSNTRPTRKSARLDSEKPRAATSPGQPSGPTPAPSPTLTEDQKVDLILRLWENPTFALSDIADALNLPMPALLKLLKRPDIAAMLEQMSELLELRLGHIAAKVAPRALATLEAVQTEAEHAAASTPVSPEAIKADRRATTARNQRRLSATAILTMHRAITAAQRVALKAAPVEGRSTDSSGAQTQHKDTSQRPVPPQEAIAA